MNVSVREISAALELAIADQRNNLSEDDCEHESWYEQGYLDGLNRAADIVVIKAHGLKTGAET